MQGRWALQLALLFGLASGAIVLVDTCDRCVCSDKCLFKDAVTTAKNYRERKSTYCHVNCKSKLLTAFPINMPRNVEVLDLSNNQFQELPIDAFAQLAALRHLDLSNNFLKQASFSTVSAAYPRGRGLFDHNERLETLILVNNRIASFAPSAAWVTPFKRATRQQRFTAALAVAPSTASVCTCANHGLETGQQVTVAQWLADALPSGVELGTRLFAKALAGGNTFTLHYASGSPGAADGQLPLAFASAGAAALVLPVPRATHFALRKRGITAVAQRTPLSAVEFSATRRVVFTSSLTSILAAAGHGVTTSLEVTVEQDGVNALPLGLSTGSKFYVKVIDANTFTLHSRAGAGGAQDGGGKILLTSVSTAVLVAPTNTFSAVRRVQFAADIRHFKATAATDGTFTFGWHGFQDDREVYISQYGATTLPTMERGDNGAALTAGTTKLYVCVVDYNRFTLHTATGDCQALAAKVVVKIVSAGALVDVLMDSLQSSAGAEHSFRTGELLKIDGAQGAVLPTGLQREQRLYVNVLQQRVEALSAAAGNVLTATRVVPFAVTAASAAAGIAISYGHGLRSGIAITIEARRAAALPAGLPAGATTYYVREIDANSFTLHTDLAGATAVLAAVNQVVVTAAGSGGGRVTSEHYLSTNDRVVVSQHGATALPAGLAATGHAVTFEVTTANVATGVCTAASHGLTTGDALTIEQDAANALPGNVVAGSGRVYYARVLSASTFTLHTGKAAAGTGVNQLLVTAAGKAVAQTASLYVRVVDRARFTLHRGWGFAGAGGDPVKHTGGTEQVTISAAGIVDLSKDTVGFSLHSSSPPTAANKVRVTDVTLVAGASYATPLVVAHGLFTNDPVVLRTSAAAVAPVGLAVGTLYYARFISASTFTLHTALFAAGSSVVPPQVAVASVADAQGRLFAEGPGGGLQSLTRLDISRNLQFGALPLEALQALGGVAPHLTSLRAFGMEAQGALPSLHMLRAVQELDLGFQRMEGAVDRDIRVVAADASNIFTAVAPTGKAHSLATNMPVTIVAVPASATLPAGVAHGMVYYARVIDAVRFTLHRTAGAGGSGDAANNALGSGQIIISNAAAATGAMYVRHAGFATLAQLTSLSLFNNRLSGSLPDLTAAKATLRSLNLAQNGFSGTIPTGSAAAPFALKHLTAVTTLRLHSNLLSGALPDDLPYAGYSSCYFARNSFNCPVDTPVGGGAAYKCGLRLVAVLTADSGDPTPNLVTAVAASGPVPHSLTTDDAVFISGTAGATLPTGLAKGQKLYARVATSSTFTLHTSAGVGGSGDGGNPVVISNTASATGTTYVYHIGVGGCIA
jgi:hypothetical protein